MFSTQKEEPTITIPIPNDSVTSSVFFFKSFGSFLSQVIINVAICKTYFIIKSFSDAGLWINDSASIEIFFFLFIPYCWIKTKINTAPLWSSEESNVCHVRHYCDTCMQQFLRVAPLIGIKISINLWHRSAFNWRDERKNWYWNNKYSINSEPSFSVE